MTSLNRLLASILLALLAGPGLSHAMQQQAGAIPGQLYVQFTVDNLSFAAGKTGYDVFDNVAARYSVTVVEKAFPSLDAIARHRPLSPAAQALQRVYVLRYASSHSPDQVARALETVPEVGYTEPVYAMRTYGTALGDWLATPNDPRYGNQIHLPRMQLPDAWDEVKGEDGSAVIAIVDGGTGWRHEDLEGNVWTNPDEVPDNGVDDDNNGFVDDIHGWNFNEDKPDPTGPSGSTTAWHGTAVAGTAAAVTDNNMGIAGSSWNALFMGVNVSCSDQALLCHSYEGILYAAMNGADAITASFGNASGSTTSELVIQAALDEGALVVAASGNGGVNVDRNPHYPSSYPATLSVGGIYKNSDRNTFNYGQTVNVFAPSTNINVTTPGDQYGTASGTSFSVPLVAGVAALVKTKYPAWSPDRVREQIRLTAVNIDADNAGREGEMGRGKVDAYAAVTAAPLPAIRVAQWAYQNQSGNQQLVSGDEVDVEVTFKNHHGDGQDISVELTAEETFLQWSVQKVALGSMTYGETRDATFTFTIDASAPSNRTIGLVPLITAGQLTDRPDRLRVNINQTGVAAHTTPALSASITDEGNIGHTSYQGTSGSRGIGFVAKSATGPARDILYEGGLLIATSSTRVSDCIRQTETNLDDQQEDFVLLDGSSLEVTSPGVFAAEEGRVVINDSQASDPIGVEVLQESFADDAIENEDFLVVKYTITNKSSATINNMYAGLFFDWDIDVSANDVTRYDATRSVGYLQDSATNPSVVAGTKLLTDSPTFNYSAIDNAATIYRGSGDGGFTPQEKWAILSGGLQNDGVVAGDKDMSQITAAGPFSLEPQTSVEVAFAIISGTSESDFLTNTDNAVKWWKQISTSAEHDALPAGGWTVEVPYPHPVIFPAELRFQTAAQSMVQVDIYDMLGRRVRQVLNAQRPQGQHVVVWGGQDETGQHVSSGLYFVRMVAQSGSQRYARSRPVMVVR